MKYNVREYIDIPQFEKLMKEFYNLTGIPYGLIGADGEILSGIGWQPICVDFHRANRVSAEVCRKSDLKATKLDCNEAGFIYYECKHGLIEMFRPIIIEGELVATLCLGQFFFEEPDKELFRKQAVKYGYDEKAYLEALSKVNVIEKHKAEAAMKFYCQIADMMSATGVNRLQRDETHEDLLRYNQVLEQEITDRTAKLVEANIELEKDILKRKEIEVELKKNEEKYKSLFEKLPYGVYLRNKETVLFANEIAAKYFDLESAEDLIGMNIKDIFVPQVDYEKSYNENLEELYKNRTAPLKEEFLISKKSNKILNLETVKTFFPYNGENLILVVFRDVSERKQLEKLNKEIEESKQKLQQTLEYDKIKTEFFANISHELKTPINVIYSALQVFQTVPVHYESPNEKKQIHKYVNIMKQNCFRLIRLINNLLDITKIDSGYLNLNLINCDVVNVVENIAMSVVEYINNKSLSLVFDTDIEEKIMAIDPDKIERIILNLLSNAVKFTEPGGKIFVDILDEGQSIVIKVRDTGVGIPKEKQRLIFDRFMQVDKSLSRAQEGSGIGLSLTQALVKLHNGNVRVKSEVGEGTEFIVELPVRLVKQSIVAGEDNICSTNSHIQKANIEFSDIYM